MYLRFIATGDKNLRFKPKASWKKQGMRKDYLYG